MRKWHFAAIVPAVLASLALAATSWAYFAATGSGSATGSADASRQVVIAAGTTPGATLLPTNESTGTITVSIDNQTGSPLHAGALVLDTARGANGYSAEAVRCKVTYTAQDNGGAGWSLGAGTTQISLPNSVKMGTDAPSDCQGSTIAIFLATA